MILSIICDNKTGLSQYIYLKDNSLYGYAINDLGYQKVDSNIIQKLFGLLKGNNYKYLSKYLEFDVFIDENGLKHFYKNNVEDYTMFLKYNGEDFVFYDVDDNKEKNNSLVKKLVVGGIVIIIGVNAFLLCQDFINKETIVTDVSSSMVSNDLMDVDEAIMLLDINKDVDMLKCDELLKTVFPYYKGSKMQYLLRERLTDIKFNYFDDSVRDSLGYYDLTNPNVLNIAESAKNEDSVKRHEFIHLLQNPDFDEMCIREAMAAISAKEFYGEYDGSYYMLTRNIYMLAAIIGPEPFYQMTYTGDANPFYNAISPYLSEEELGQFKEVLCSDPEEIDIHEMEQFISTIYKNKHGEDMMGDEFMYWLYTDLSLFERVNLFNPYKVSREEIVEVDQELFQELDLKPNFNDKYVIKVNIYDKFSDQYERLEGIDVNKGKSAH